MPILHASVRILGCGNLLMGNDGVGLKVIEALQNTEMECLKNLDIVDAGVCGLDLLNYFDGAKKVIIVDAVLADSPIGSVHRLDGKDIIKSTEEPLNLVSGHDLTITDVLRIGEHVQTLPEIVVIGIEIGTIVTEATLEITPEVLEGVDEAIRLITEEISSTF
ncbi:MAG: hydrogenase maturation protease [Methanosarcina sp.]|nr:F420-nonreducing hydrogenase [Methanosarcina sp. Ant1]